MPVDTEKISKNLVPEYIRELKTYQAGKPISELAREKGLTRITKLASNENPLGPSQLAMAEMKNALQESQLYPDQHAYYLKKALCDLYDLNQPNVILGNGSEGIMAYIAKAFLTPGTEVLTSEKTFIGFYILARSVGAHLKTVPMTSDYRFDVQKLAESITGKTKLIYIANPNNPTGTHITKNEFDFLMESVPNHCLVVLDEAYFEFAREYTNYPDSMDYRYDNVITLRTFSKAYGLAGVRIGYGFGHENIISNLTKVKLPFEPSLLAQSAGVGALKDRSHLEKTIQNNSKLIKECRSFLEEKGFSPIDSLTNFLTIRTGSLEASEHLFQNLLNCGVIIRGLKANEMPDFVRVSIGSESEMQHFYEAMEKVLPQFDSLYGRVK